jgi:beta-glucosidase
VQAVKDHIISESQIDISVTRLFMIRFRLGLFDPVSMVKYAQVPETVLENKDHKNHALKMARQSIVLLKNENHVLPLRKDIKKIAVVGPNADNPIAILGNYNGVPSSVVTALQGIKEKLSKGVEIVYEKAINFTNDTLFQRSELNNQFSWQGQQGFSAEYYNNKELKGMPVAKRVEASLENNWQEGQIINDTLKAYNFSARYTTDFTAPENGLVSFELEADDGYRFLIDGNEVLNAWVRNRWGAKTCQLSVSKGRVYRLVVEYYQTGGKASIRLSAGQFQKTDFAKLTNRLKDADVIIFVGGISPQLEGEEMQVNYPGFSGGDRTSILLPAIQTEFLQALKNTGKPVVFVMMTGSAIAIPWEAQNINAIVNAWYGGQSAGTAIADVLFGDYNPAGRLPVTFYKSDNDLPDFTDYRMDNRTYRYFKGSALYQFGYGLSYTSFVYDQLSIRQSISQEKSFEISATVANTGTTGGEEVVQLYISGQGARDPVRSLKGFQRIYLKKGERKRISFTLKKEDITTLDENGNPQLLQGKFIFSIGGCQPDAATIKNKKIVEGILKL